MTQRLRSIFVIACVVALGVALAISDGTPFGSRNQNTYVLDALVRAFPDLYRNDWFVTHTHHYHVAFAYATAPLFALDADGAIAFGIAQIVVMVATFGAIYLLIATVTQHARLITFLGIAGFVALGSHYALGGTYLYTGYLQPSSLATLGWLLAVIFWIRDRPLAAGLALAAGGAFHVNYAVLGIGLFACCEIATRRFDLRRMIALLAPSLALAAVFLPMLIASSRADNKKQALDLLVQFALSGHFKPSRVRLELMSLVGWHVLALAIHPVANTAARAKLFWFAMFAMASCILAVVLVQFPPLLSLTRLFTWRIAPFGILAAQILLFVWVREVVRGERALPTRWQIVGLLLGASFIIHNAFTRPRQENFPEVVTGVMAAIAVAVVVRREQIATVICGALCALALWLPRARLLNPVMFDTHYADASRWARTATDRDALFLIPPYVGEWRLATRRAVVIDDKSLPLYMGELFPWYHRLCDGVDAQSLRTIDEGWRRWDALPAERLLAVAQKLHANYIMLDKNRSAARLNAAIAYEDADTLVYAIAKS